MTFRIITVFEKEGAQIESEIWATPGWFKFQQFYLLENNSYLCNLDKKISEDGSYLEYYVDYHDEEAFLAWYEEWKDLYDNLRTQVIENLKSRGVQHTVYWPETSFALIEDPDVRQLIQFQSKLPLPN
jgi:hypothetical protein